MKNQHMNICSTSLATGKCKLKKNKTQCDYHHMPIRKAKIKNGANTKYWRGYGETVSAILCWWAHKMVQPLLKIL